MFAFWIPLPYIRPMSALTAAIERELPQLEPEAARSFELAVEAMLRMARRRAQGPSTRQDPPTPYVTNPRPIGLKTSGASHKWSDWLDEVERPNGK